MPVPDDELGDFGFDEDEELMRQRFLRILEGQHQNDEKLDRVLDKLDEMKDDIEEAEQQAEDAQERADKNRIYGTVSLFILTFIVIGLTVGPTAAVKMLPKLLGL